MSAGSNLQGAGGLTLEQRITNIEAALRGGPPVADALGVPTDGDVDLGSALNAWRDIFAVGLVVGGARVDVASLATSAAVYPFTASDATYSWPGDQTRVLMLLWSSASGGGGGGGAGNLDGNNYDPGSRGSFGGNGFATTVTIGGTTYSSGASLGGAGGEASDSEASLSPNRRGSAIPGGAGGAGGAGTYSGGGGTSGVCALRYFVRQGLSQGDIISIVVPIAVGSGGSGGSGSSSGGAAGGDGSDGVSPGLAILLALPL